jgi:hypothetical protein
VRAACRPDLKTAVSEKRRESTVERMKNQTTEVL